MILINLCLVAAVAAQPTFTQIFTPDNIGPGSATLLTYTVTNGSGTPVTDLAFTNTLPAGMTIATPAIAQSTCGEAFTLSASDGGSTITFSDGVVGGGNSCTVTVYVTSSTPGTHSNLSGDLTSSAGNSGTSTDDLTVSSNRPGFTKSFAPSSIDLGEVTTLTFNIDNTANTSQVTNLSFMDNLPGGLTVANPPNASSTCAGGIITATPGTQLITYTLAFSGDAAVMSGGSCQVIIDVQASAVGVMENVSSDLTGLNISPLQNVNSGKAISPITVTRGDPLHISKQFLNDPVGPGSLVDLEFTITNFDRDLAASAITFTDDLDAMLSGLVAVGLPTNDVCGSGSTLSGTSVITLSGGNLSADGGTCTFVVTCQVPGGATAGEYSGNTSLIMGDVGGPVVGNMANAKLFVQPVPMLTKTFLPNQVLAGGSTTMEFTINNTSSTSAATDISFTDNLGQFLSGAAVEALPPANSCGAGSIVTTFLDQGELTLLVTNANLVASGSCTFSIDLGIPQNTPGATYPNITSDVTAMIDGNVATGHPATADLTVLALPRLHKEVLNDPVGPGEVMEIEFIIAYDEFASGDATNVSFTDDLNAALSGLTAIGLPLNDICGAGSSLTGTSNLIFSGGTMSPGDTCKFVIEVDVPADAQPGTYTNTTSDLTATVGGLMGANLAASDDFLIGGLELTKEFIDDPAIPGDLVTLRFTIDNTTTVDATGIFFTDNLAANLPGLVAEAPLPAEPCGMGSSVSGASFLIFVGGSVDAGTSCSFDIAVRIPGGAVNGSYQNLTSALTATLGGNVVVLPPASNVLEVNSELISLTKSFIDDPVMAGSTATLEFVLNNLDPTRSIEDISFTDDLDAALSGLVATGLPMNDVCGTGSSLTGTSLLTFTGGTLAGGASCTFSVDVQVPAMAAAGDYLNTTSPISGTSSGLPVDGSAASDALKVRNVEFTKAFDGSVVAGNSTMLTFTLSNLDQINPISNLEFNDDLNAMLSGATVVSLPDVSSCGAGAEIAGTSLLTFTDGELAAGSNCSFDVEILIPCGALGGTYPNATSDLFVNGLSISPPATDDLSVMGAPPATFTRPPDTTIYLGLNCTFDKSPAVTGDVTDEMHSCCMGPLDATFTDMEMLVGCSGTGTINRSWTVTDCNGVMSPTQIQVITVLDTTKPMITVCPPDPGPILLPDPFNTGSVPPNTPQDPIIDPAIYGFAMGTDNCPDTTVTYQDKLTGPTPENCPILYQVERTWVITDACGLTDTCVQTFSFTLDQVVLGPISGPVTICPDFMQLEYNVEALPDVSVYTWSFSDGSATISDNGSNHVLINFDETFAGGSLSVISANACGGIPSTVELVKGESSLCDLFGCMSEAESLVIDNTILDAVGALDVYQNYNKIESDAMINAMRDIIFKAGNEIVLNPPFTVELGATFIAEIEQCMEEASNRD